MKRVLIKSTPTHKYSHDSRIWKWAKRCNSLVRLRTANADEIVKISLMKCSVWPSCPLHYWLSPFQAKKQCHHFQIHLESPPYNSSSNRSRSYLSQIERYLQFSTHSWLRLSTRFLQRSWGSYCVAFCGDRNKNCLASSIVERYKRFMFNRSNHSSPRSVSAEDGMRLECRFCGQMLSSTVYLCPSSPAKSHPRTRSSYSH